MATITTARAGLVTFGSTVAKPGGGVFASYDLKGFFNAVPPIIPCLIALLDLEEQPGWQALASLGGGPTTEFVMFHYALWKAVADNEDFTYIEPDMLAIVDNYQAALTAQPYLTPASAPSIHYAPKVHWKISRAKFGEIQYHALIFRLECGLNL